MWIFLSESFLSVVADRGDPRKLLVRARVAGDIERVFPDQRFEVQHTPEADYPYRAFLPRALVVRVISEELAEIGYVNFKSSVQEADRRSAYTGCWFELRDLQMRRENRLRVCCTDDDPCAFCLARQGDEVS